MCANKKIQDTSMKAATGNHQILGLPIVSQRPRLCQNAQKNLQKWNLLHLLVKTR